MKKKILPPIASLTAIAGVCAAILAAVDATTKGPIAERRAKKETEAVRAVMPSGVTDVAKEGDFFVGMNAAGETLGYAAKGVDPKGYGGDIELMVGFEKDRRTVVCYRTLAAAETPGLGMKLKTKEFSGQFEGKKAGSLKVAKDGGDITAITSATITSRAVCRAIENAAAKL